MTTNDIIRHDQPLGLRAWKGSSPGMRQAHCHFDLELNYVLEGNMSYLIDGVKVELPQDRLCVLWGAVPHQTLHSATGIQAIWVTIASKEVLRWNLPEWFMNQLIQKGLFIDTDAEPADIYMLQRWIRDLEEPDTSEYKRGVLLMEIATRLHRMALTIAHQFPTEHSLVHKKQLEMSGDGADAVEAMARFISDNYQNDITVAQIARVAHLHPSYAMTLFRSQTGITLNRYLTLQRVARAQRLLGMTQQPITHIAFESGFGSVSRFYEAFREETGCSPRRFRLQLSGFNSQGNRLLE